MRKPAPVGPAYHGNENREIDVNRIFAVSKNVLELYFAERKCLSVYVQIWIVSDCAEFYGAIF